MNLNNLKQIEKLDQGKVAESIASLPQQIADVLKQAEGFVLPESFKQIDRVVINGMGGSNLGARIISSVFKDEARVPVMIEPGYQVPGCVNDKTLYIISSYSGTTEEPLSTLAEVKERGAKIVGLTEEGKGSKLAKILKEAGLPVLTFNSSENPSGQPRLGVGYAIFALLALLAQAGVIEIDQQEIAAIIAALAKNNKLLGLKTGASNPAKQVAKKLFGREVILVGAEFLEGNLHAWRNQFCETSKNFASYLVLPELNHYALEGLAHPQQNKQDLIFVFLASALYRPRIKKRSALTQEIVGKNRIKSVEITLKGKTKLAQAAEALQLGSWITFYLAMLNEVNPVSIKWVDYFKKRLS